MRAVFKEKVLSALFGNEGGEEVRRQSLKASQRGVEGYSTEMVGGRCCGFYLS